LCRRVSPRLAERMILEGEVYSSEEMHRLGVVDVLVPRGEGEAAVHELIRRHQRAPHAYLAMNAVRGIGQPVSCEELLRITEVWVDTALALDAKSLRTMERIVRAQERRAGRAGWGGGHVARRGRARGATRSGIVSVARLAGSAEPRLHSLPALRQRIGKRGGVPPPLAAHLPLG